MFLSKLYRCLEVREGGRKRGGRERGGGRGRERGREMYMYLMYFIPEESV